jgi:2-methylcitrate dehydratase PrpD
MTVSQTLARFVTASRREHVAEPVQDEAVRALVDWLACCLGGCLDPALDAIRAAPEPERDDAQATLPGRGTRSDVVATALLAGMASDALGFAAEHAPTGVPVSVPVAAALLPLAEAGATPGADLVHAYAIGAELTCRMARALAQEGRTLGLRARRLCGSVGAAAGCAKLLALDAARVAHAIDTAADLCASLDSAEPSGESFEAAQAVRTGLVAALRARENTAAGAGLQPMLGPEQAAALLAGLGEEWALAHSAYKSFPCDGALQAAIEACLGARARRRVLTRHIADVELHVHPCVLARSLGGPPANGVQARRSLSHAAAVALVDGAAGREQFSDWRVSSPRIAELRRRIRVLADDTLAPEAARVALHLADGRIAEHGVRCARGFPARPLTDAELSDKFRDLASELLATDQAERLLALVWNVRALGDVGALVRASVPEETSEPAQLPGSPLLPR